MGGSYNVDPSLCVKCKMNPRRMLCGKPRCPLRMKFNSINPVKPLIKGNEISGATPPSFFVGSFGWPKVRAGPMIPVLTDIDDVLILDEPDMWYPKGAKTGEDIQQILNWRAGLIRTSELLKVDQFDTSKQLSTAQETLMSEIPVNLSATLEKPVKLQLKMNQFTQPVGPHGKGIKKLVIEDNNVKIAKHVDRVVDDTDLKANIAVNDLYESKMSVTKINRILSAGLLGTAKKRKLVPTRWSITATDDIIGKKMIEKVKSYQELGEFRVFQSTGYMDNWYSILLLPREWSFEQIEAWGPGWTGLDKNNTKLTFAVDQEFYHGRTTYASNVAGGYYAGRIAVLEYLTSIRRQAAAVVFREIRSGYVIPLGVWQVRENMRRTMEREYESFSSLEEALSNIENYLGKSLKPWIKRMKFLKMAKTQRRLIEYFKI